MRKLFDLVLSGAVTGSIYSIMASGLVLTYSTSGIFNFSHAAIAFAVAYLYYQLHVGLGVPIVPAALVSVVLFAPLLGILLDRLLLRRLGQAPVYARIVGTLGLLVALPNLLQWLVETIGIDTLHLNSFRSASQTENGGPVPGIGPFPAHEYHLVRGVALSSDQLAVFIVTVVAAAALWYVLQRTRIGLDMRAVVDRSSLAGLRGINPSRTSAVAWMLTMLLAGLGGVLITPLFTLDPNIFTLVVLSSLAAVVLAGLHSLPIAFVGGLGIGVAQNLVAGYSSDLPKSLANVNGLASAFPYLLVIVIGLLVGRDRSRTAGTVAEERSPVDHRDGLSALRRRAPWAVALLLMFTYAMGWFSWFRANNYDQTVIAQSLALGVILLSYVIVTGMGGMVSMAQPTFATAGGFAAGWALNRNWGIDVPLVATHGHLNFLWATLLGVVAGAAVGLVIALPATRLGAVYLAIWSLAAAFFFSLVVFAFESIGHGQNGWNIRFPSLSVPGLNFLHRLIVRHGGHFNFSSVRDQIVLFLVVFGLISLLIHSLIHSSTGRAILAVRSSPTAARAVGIRADRTRIVIFAVAAGVAGLGGVMLSMFSFSASNSTAPPAVGMGWLVAAVLFGIRRPGGALLAGFSVGAGTAIFNRLSTAVGAGTLNHLLTSPYFIPMLTGLGAIQLAQEPDGVLSLVGGRNAQKRAAKTRATHITHAEVALHAETPTIGDTSVEVAAADVPASRATPALAAVGIRAGYGDARVLHRVSVALEPGRIVALLGANGAGKSTLCSVLAGTLEPESGTVTIDGRNVTSIPAHERARAGLLFIPEARGIFPGLNVEENLAVLLRAPTERQAAYDRFPVLAERRRNVAGQLSGGEQQMLSLAPALASPPRVLIADEPTLGLAPMAAKQVMDAIVEIRDLGTSVLLAEEHTHNALQIADTIVVMELGRVLWSGPREEATLDQLGAAYLGLPTAG
ncbi:MAG: ATP-binding cassette domain-containing protein [Actinomycetota bacterium]|nr:ATP-binding cassette domain-containing protein [Actinomycetota bacterium]